MKFITKRRDHCLFSLETFTAHSSFDIVRSVIFATIHFFSSTIGSDVLSVLTELHSFHSTVILTFFLPVLFVDRKVIFILKTTFSLHTTHTFLLLYTLLSQSSVNLAHFLAVYTTHIPRPKNKQLRL